MTSIEYFDWKGFCTMQVCDVNIMFSIHTSCQYHPKHVQVFSTSSYQSFSPSVLHCAADAYLTQFLSYLMDWFDFPNNCAVVLHGKWKKRLDAIDIYFELSIWWHSYFYNPSGHSFTCLLWKISINCSRFVRKHFVIVRSFLKFSLLNTRYYLKKIPCWTQVH